MSHSRIFVVREVADTKTGDHFDKIPWKKISETAIPDSMWSSFADYIGDVPEDQWTDDVKWLLRNIEDLDDDKLESTCKVLEDGHLYFKVKIRVLKSYVIRRLLNAKEHIDKAVSSGIIDFMTLFDTESALNYKYGFHIIHFGSAEDTKVTDCSVDTLMEWASNLIPMHEDLSDEDELAFVVMGVIDFHD